MTDSTTYTGHRAVTSSGSSHNVERLHIDKALSEHRTAVPVKIVKVYPDANGGAPTADVQVMVDQVDGLGSSPTPHAVVYGVTVGRVHSGSGAIVSDPVAGDLYHMAVHDRDVSKFKASGGQQSSPDTKRRGSLSDGHLTHAILSKTTAASPATHASQVGSTFTPRRRTPMASPPTSSRICTEGRLLGGRTTGWRRSAPTSMPVHVRAVHSGTAVAPAYRRHLAINGIAILARRHRIRVVAGSAAAILIGL